jgi:hypothetical protein
MKKFLIQGFIFSILFLALFASVLTVTSSIVKSRNFKIYETESNTLVIKDHEHFDLGFMGISHARNFSRHKNHIRVENILHKKIMNLGQGGGACGVNEQLFYLKYFYAEHNSVDTMIYVLTPVLFYSNTLATASNTFDEECFSLKFFFNYLFFDSENKIQRINQYVRTKLTGKWIYNSPTAKEVIADSVMAISIAKYDSAEVRKGMQVAYPDGLDRKRFLKSCFAVEETIKLAKENNTYILFIIPPALFGKWPGHDNVASFAVKMREKYKVGYYDFSETMKDPSDYYEHHHLNTKGVVYFTQHYLKELLENKSPEEQ